MKFEEVLAAIKAYGFKNAQVFVTDADYARPMTSYLTGTYYDFYSRWLSDHNISQWNARWDCDNFSSTYYVFSQMCHVKSRRPEQGIAIGEVFYMKDTGEGHAVNCAITEKGFILIEPQNGQEFEMSSTEKLKTVMVRF